MYAEIFEDGETSGKKANPSSVAKNMRYGVDEDGKIILHLKGYVFNKFVGCLPTL
jgi:hypothetical protein